MDGMFYLDENTLNKLLSVFLIMDVELLKSLSKHGANGLVSEIKKSDDYETIDNREYDGSSLIYKDYKENDDSYYDEDSEGGFKENNTMFSSSGMINMDSNKMEDSKGIRTEFVNKKVREIIERLNEFNIEKDGSTLENFEKEDLIDVWGRVSPLYLFFYIVNLGISIGLFVRNRSFLTEVYNYPASFDIFEPNLCKTYNSIEDFINRIELLCVQDRKLLVEKRKSEEDRFLFFVQFFHFIKDLNQDTINKLVERFISASKKYFYRNYDILMKKFRYLIEKYFNLPVVYVLDILNIFILYSVTEFIMDYINIRKNKEMFVDDFLKSLEKESVSKDNKLNKNENNIFLAGIRDSFPLNFEIEKILDELKEINRIKSKGKMSKYFIDFVEFDSNKFFIINGKKVVEIKFKKNILSLN